MFKRTLLVSLVLVLVFGFCSVGGEKVWSEFPSTQKFHFYIHDASGNREISIAGFYFTEQNMKIALGDKWVHETDRYQAFRDQVSMFLPDRVCLFVGVEPLKQNPYFNPESFYFAQHGKTYKYDPDKLNTYSDDFMWGKGPLIRTITGVLAVPEGIDTAEGYIIGYGHESASNSTYFNSYFPEYMQN